jgi:hypothetical protein
MHRPSALNGCLGRKDVSLLAVTILMTAKPVLVTPCVNDRLV